MENFIDPIGSSIESLSKEIDGYHAVLNDESIWLFLAILGCWSVTQGIPRRVSFALVLILYVWRIANRITNWTLFSKTIKQLRKRIVSVVDDPDYQKAREFDLQNVEKKLSIKKIAWVTSPYLIAILFFAYSVFLNERP